MSAPRICWVDAETTAIQPRGVHGGTGEIWELGLIVRELPGSAASDGEYLWHFRPDLTGADPGSLKVGGYYDRCRVRGLQPGAAKRLTQPDDMEADPAIIETRLVAHEVAGLLSGAHLIAANPAFDAGHVDSFLRLNGELLTADYHLIDLASLVRGWAHGSASLPARCDDLPWPLKLHDAARLAGIDPGDYETHTGLGDVRLGRDVFDAVTGGAR